MFVDETWVFSRDGIKRLWQDDNCKSIENDGGTGSRYIVIYAESEEECIEESGLIFSSSIEMDDFHDNMNTDLYVKCLKKKILISLKEPACIVLNNAPYHSIVINAQPNASSKKQKITEWLIKKIITVSETAIERNY